MTKGPCCTTGSLVGSPQMSTKSAAEPNVLTDTPEPICITRVHHGFVSSRESYAQSVQHWRPCSNPLSDVIELHCVAWWISCLLNTATNFVLGGDSWQRYTGSSTGTVWTALRLLFKGIMFRTISVSPTSRPQAGRTLITLNSTTVATHRTL